MASEPEADRYSLAERRAEERRQGRRVERRAREAAPTGGGSSESCAEPCGAEGRAGCGADSEAELTGEAGLEPEAWQDATRITTWYGGQIVSLIHAARREKALTRLRALASALDTWSKLLRLANESSEIEAIKAELGELRRELESQRAGPLKAVR